VLHVLVAGAALMELGERGGRRLEPAAVQGQKALF
jgi:hypothetical protein